MAEANIFSDAQIGVVIARGLDPADLAAMPQAPKPDSAIEIEVADEIEYQGARGNPERQAEIRAEVSRPGPAFPVRWGLVRLEYTRGEDDYPECFSLEVYLHAAIEQPGSTQLLADLVTAGLRKRITAAECRAFSLDLDDDAGGPLSCALLEFRPLGFDPQDRVDRGAVAAFLSALIGSGRLSAAVDEALHLAASGSEADWLEAIFPGILEGCGSEPLH